MTPPGRRRVRIVHDTDYRYGVPVELAHHSAHLRPRDTLQQRVLGWTCRIDPEPDGGAAALQQGLDVYGNWRLGFSHTTAHDRLVVRVQSEVELQLCEPGAGDALADATSQPWERAVPGAAPIWSADFALASPRVPLDPEIAAFARQALWPGRPWEQALHALNQQVHRHVRYEPWTTDVDTDALQALRQGRGVCQDHAHLMIGACRALGLAARYVSGYLVVPDEADPEGGGRTLLGAGATHAWVEVLAPWGCWVGWDPTNALRVAHDHVVLAWGRDYTDVAPLRGVIRGGGHAPPRVNVQVLPLP